MPKRVRTIRIEGNLAFVPLTKGYEAVIDACDASLVAAWNWHARTDTNTVYAARNIEKDASGLRGAISMHRQISNNPDGMEVDHWDGDGLNNRRINLRIATKSENQRNRKTSTLSQTGLKGVSPYNRNGTWHARISINGKRISLGYYKTPEEAHSAYCNASAEMHGEFGRTA